MKNTARLKYVCTPNNVILDIYVDNDSLVSINSTHLFCGVLSCVDQLDTSFLQCVVLCRSTRHIFSAVCCLVSINSTHLFCGVLSCVDQLDTSFLRCVVLCRSTRYIFSAVCCLVSINSTHLFCGVLSCVDQLYTSFLRFYILIWFNELIYCVCKSIELYTFMTYYIV
jgi:hypothetical protein